MKIDPPLREIIAGCILTALALFFQSTPLWLPGIGLVVSPLATLPVALAAVLSLPLGVVVYIAAAFLIMLASTQEAAIFLLGTGLLGMALGIGHGRLPSQAFGIPALSLFIGLLLLAGPAMIPVFGPLTPSALLVRIPVFLLFCAVYTALWMAVIPFVLTLLNKIPLHRK